ncbi:hypothetical protein [Paenibacillus sp. S150]|uniref:hypothetical protein n=1 Tax=Paenibacillus sp. S150 TaxID=2749826 RepID=UPI001C5722FC|nr:hypothetical protein [Paenibacillus sp. S150]MBW4082693.1 hypothetical protein [Paenibacillus sp. S150]
MPSSPDVTNFSLSSISPLQFVRRGLVVNTPDIVGFGERVLKDLAENRAAPSSYRMSTQLPQARR